MSKTKKHRIELILWIIVLFLIILPLIFAAQSGALSGENGEGDGEEEGGGCGGCGSCEDCGCDCEGCGCDSCGCGGDDDDSGDGEDPETGTPPPAPEAPDPCEGMQDQLIVDVSMTKTPGQPNHNYVVSYSVFNCNKGVGTVGIFVLAKGPDVQRTIESTQANVKQKVANTITFDSYREYTEICIDTQPGGVGECKPTEGG